MKIAPSCALLAFVVACGPAPELKRRAPLFTTFESQFVAPEKDFDQLIHDKYQDQITLNCAFIIDDREGYNISGFKPATFSWDLIGGKRPEAMTFRMNNGRNFSVRVDVSAFKITDKNYVDAAGTEYIMKNTPEVELTLNAGDSFKKTKSKQIVKIYENVPEIVINDLFDKKLPQDLRCSLKTVIAPDFSDQWRIVEKTPEVPVEPAPVTEPAPEDQPSHRSENPSGQENDSSQDGPDTGTH